jgi:hypothetical protein
VLEGLPEGAAAEPFGSVGWLDGVMMEVMTTTGGVSPGTVVDGVTVMTDVRTSVADGGAEGAVEVNVVAGAGFELAGGGADDCAGGGALEAGGGAEDAGGGFDEGAGVGDGEGACEEGGSAEEGGLEDGGGADEGAGPAEESAGGVTDGKGAEEEAAGVSDCAAGGLEGSMKEEANVLAVPLLDMLTTIATRTLGATRNNKQAKATRQHTQRRRRGRGAALPGFRG